MCVFLIAHGRLLKPHEFLYGILASTRCSHYIPVSRMCTPFLEPGFDRDTLLNGDETIIYIDPPKTATFAPIGSGRV